METSQTSSHFSDAELASGERTSDIIVACPRCHGTNAIRRDRWMATVRSERDKTETMRESGPIDGFRCPNCKEKIPNREWHRSLEQSQFQAKGWYTPRMVSR